MHVSQYAVVVRHSGTIKPSCTAITSSMEGIITLSIKRHDSELRFLNSLKLVKPRKQSLNALYIKNQPY